MCESNAYLIDQQGREKLLMENVILLEPKSGGILLLVNLLGEKRLVRARLENIDFMKHRLSLRKPSRTKKGKVSHSRRPA
jgi:predicted RNA-binding protein